MADSSFLSVLPSLLAIVLAVWTRQVFVSLIGGIWLGCSLLLMNPVAGLSLSLDKIIGVFGSMGDARVIVFTLCVGGLIALLEFGGGVKGFVAWLEQRQWADNPKRAQWLAWLVGVVIFIESNITVLVAGTTARPLFDKFKIPREKLAYIIDSTSAPICILIPFNAWGAFNLGLLSGSGVEQPLTVFVSAVALNLYAIITVALAALVITFDINFGPMKRATFTEPEYIAAERAGEEPVQASSPMMMLLPIAVLVAAMPVGLWLTGNGDILAGSGSKSVLVAVLLATFVAATMILFKGIARSGEVIDEYMRGAGRLVPVAVVLLLALALGGISKELNAGAYIAGLVKDSLPAFVLLPLLFLIASAVAFAIGSSWGTFAIMIPIAIQASSVVELAPAAFLAAVLSGGIFGDHASPISDTTVMSSMAADVDHIEHVRTQLPYALLAAFLSVIGFSVMGLVSA